MTCARCRRGFESWAFGPRSRRRRRRPLQVAAQNGLYTEELLETLREPGLKIEEVFKRVRINVSRRSKGAQTPWESSSLTMGPGREFDTCELPGAKSLR